MLWVNVGELAAELEPFRETRIQLRNGRLRWQLATAFLFDDPLLDLAQLSDARFVSQESIGRGLGQSGLHDGVNPFESESLRTRDHAIDIGLGCRVRSVARDLPALLHRFRNSSDGTWIKDRDSELHVESDFDTSVEMASTGKRIQAAREMRGLSRQELAKLLGTTRMTVYRVEVGIVGLNTKKLPKWAQALKTSVAELVA